MQAILFIRSMQLGKIQMSTESPFKKFYKRKYTAGRKKPGDKRSIPKIDENIRKKIQEKMLKIPPGLELVIEKYIENKTGKQLESPGTLERIRQAVLVQKPGTGIRIHMQNMREGMMFLHTLLTRHQVISFNFITSSRNWRKLASFLIISGFLILDQARGLCLWLLPGFLRRGKRVP